MAQNKSSMIKEHREFSRGQVAFGPQVYGLLWTLVGYSIKVDCYGLLLFILVVSFVYYLRFDQPLKYLVSIMDKWKRNLLYSFELVVLLLFFVFSLALDSELSELILNLMIPIAAISNLLIIVKVYSESTLLENGWVKK